MFTVLQDSIRHRHVHVIGRTQSGKSTLLVNLAYQDIKQGKGVGIIDPHGDFAERILNTIPKARKDDVIYFDAADPIPINVMDCEEGEEARLADDLLVAFKRSSDTWGERMDAICRYAFNTLIRVPGATFLDLYTLLDPATRPDIIRKLPDKFLKRYWKDFPYKADAINPILSRLSKYILSPPIKIMLGTPNAKLNLYDVMQKKQIFIANLARGKVGESTASLIGSIIVSKLQQAAFRRASLAVSDRIPFYLYVDEFQNFVTSAFDVILSEAAKYQLCLTVAHQYIEQIQDSKVKFSVLKNPGVVIDFSGEVLKKPKDREDEDIPPYHALLRGTKSSKVIIRSTLPPLQGSTKHAEYIKNRTKDQYPLQKEEKDAEIRAREKQVNSNDDSDDFHTDSAAPHRAANNSSKRSN